MTGTGLSLERRIQIGFGVAVAIIAGVGAAALRSTQATVDSARWVAHTLQVRAELEGAFADLIEAETGVRGYVITSDTSYLAPYHAARTTLRSGLAGLRALTADNPAQQRRLDSLETLVATRLDRLQRTIDTRRTAGLAAAARAVIGGGGKELTQLAHELFTRMEDDEARLLAERSATLQARARLARLAAWTGVLVASVLAGLAGVLVGREMAARRRAEQALRETQTRFQQMLGSSTAVIYANTVSGTTFSPSWVSENVTRITGYRSDEPLQPSWWLDNLHPDDRARVLAEMPALFADDQLTTEYRFRGKDGAYRWVHDESRLLRDATGRPIEVVGSWVDVTARREAEVSLRAGEERLRLLVGSVRDYAIYMLDPDGHVRSWNAGAQHIKGYTEAEILGQHFSRFYTPEDVAGGRPAAALRATAAGGRFEEENWRVRKDGSRFWADVVMTAVRDDRGALVGFAKVTRDLTERKRAEQALRSYAAQLEVANKELEAFSYSVSHDLRTPLRSLDGFSQALLEDYHDRLDDTGRDFLQRVRAASQRMGTLIDDLLSLSRVTRGDLQVAAVDLSALAAAVATELKKSDPERAITFAIAPDLVARADAGLMRVVLQNLLGNAWKFTGRRPAAHVEVGVMAHDGRRAFFVRDDGAGFDMAYAAKLFGTFQRLHAAAEFPGSGIGLATVQRIIHRHGGQVWAEGAPDRGATFYFTL